MATINRINSQNPIQVAFGGTGVNTLTTYAVICGGTTSTGAIQSIASVGTANQALTSNGASALPTFQTAPNTNMDYNTVSSDPGSPVDAQVWYNTTSNAFKGEANGVTKTFTVS